MSFAESPEVPWTGAVRSRGRKRCHRLKILGVLGEAPFVTICRYRYLSKNIKGQCHRKVMDSIWIPSLRDYSLLIQDTWMEVTAKQTWHEWPVLHLAVRTVLCKNLKGILVKVGEDPGYTKINSLAKYDTRQLLSLINYRYPSYFLHFDLVVFLWKQWFMYGRKGPPANLTAQGRPAWWSCKLRDLQSPQGWSEIKL